MSKRSAALSKGFTSAAPGYWAGENLDRWDDFTWQLKNRVTSLPQLEEHLVLTEEERAGVLLSGNKLAMAITPHFFNLIHPTDPDCPIRRQVIPRIEESLGGPRRNGRPLRRRQPHAGAGARPPLSGPRALPGDRPLRQLLPLLHPQPRVSGAGEQELHTEFEAAFRYLEKHTEVRDVLLSGGDALLLFATTSSRSILKRLRAIPHIEFLRIGTRVPIFLPAAHHARRCARCWQKYHPLWMSVHVNHPRELTIEVKEALERLADHGIPLGNQSVLLRGVNDDVETHEGARAQAADVPRAAVLPLPVRPDQGHRPPAHQRARRAWRSSRACAATPPATPCRSSSSMPPAAAARCR